MCTQNATVCTFLMQDVTFAVKNDESSNANAQTYQGLPFGTHNGTLLDQQIHVNH